MSFMGLDIGTTGCKAVAFDRQGHELAFAYREYQLLSPQEGWAELDSAHVCDCCFEVIGEVARQCRSDPVRAMGISSQGEAITPVDANGTILSNAMVSSDARAAGIAKCWPERFGPQRLYQITGHTAHPMFTLFKLLWVREHQPEVWSAATAFHCFEDLLHLRLGLKPAISWPLAGRTMLFDVLEHRWDPTILAAARLDPARLARPVASGSVVGTIPRGVSDRLALSGDVAVVAGGHDQTCCALGVGATVPGKAMYATGTVECICPALGQPTFSPELQAGNLCTYDFTVPGLYTTVAFSLTGGNILKWFRDQFGQPEVRRAKEQGQDPYTLLIRSMSDRPTGLLVLPYFAPTGTPYFDTNTKGAVLGLRLTTSRQEFLRALLEGVALEMRLNVDILQRNGVEISEFVATGGGARSPEWTQLKADVLGKPLATATVAESGCFGAAMLAQSAVTGVSVQELTKANVSTGDLIEPDAQRAAYYAERFSVYKHIYPSLRGLGI